MGRWLVILSLAIAQCPDIAAATEPSSDVPLPKPRPWQPAHQKPVKAATAVPRAAPPAAEADGGGTPAEPSPADEPSPAQESSAPAPFWRDIFGSQSFGQETLGWASPALLPVPPPVEAAPVQPPETPAPPKSNRANGDCTGGKRVKSTYYWQGKRTASGEPFNPHGMTAAHRTLPFGTSLTVSNPRTGKSVIVVINDRGPFVSGVGIDLSLGAAQAIGMQGTGMVCIW
jgi:rare lipoprotein A